MQSTESKILELLAEALKLTNSLTKNRELALVATKIDEAVLWMKSHYEKKPE